MKKLEEFYHEEKNIDKQAMIVIYISIIIILIICLVCIVRKKKKIHVDIESEILMQDKDLFETVSERARSF